MFHWAKKVSRVCIPLIFILLQLSTTLEGVYYDAMSCISVSGVTVLVHYFLITVKFVDYNCWYWRGFNKSTTEHEANIVCRYFPNSWLFNANYNSRFLLFENRSVRFALSIVRITKTAHSVAEQVSCQGLVIDWENLLLENYLWTHEKWIRQIIHIYTCVKKFGL